MKTDSERFSEWMHKRGGIYAKLPMKYYKDGTPYFSYMGVEISLTDFLRREKELLQGTLF